MGALPRFAAALYVGLDVLEAIVRTDVSLSALGIFVLVMDWIALGRFRSAAAVLLMVEGFGLFRSGFSQAAVVGSILATGGAVCFGLMLRWSQQRVEGSREQARKEIYADLAVELHDTIARELSRVVVVAELLAVESGSSPLVSQIQSSAREALASTRLMMKGLRQPTEQESLDKVLGRCADMLKERSIRLHVDAAPAAHANLSREMLDILVLVIKEGSANILKYAPVGSEASLTVESESPEVLSVMLTNTCDISARPDPELSGGFGLDNLAARVEQVGGSISHHIVNNRWTLLVELPLHRVAAPRKD